MSKLLELMQFIAARLKEPSTHAALASVGAVAGMHLSDATLSNAATGLSIACGLMGMFVKENASH